MYKDCVDFVPCGPYEYRVVLGDRTLGVVGKDLGQPRDRQWYFRNDGLNVLGSGCLTRNEAVRQLRSVPVIASMIGETTNA